MRALFQVFVALLVFIGVSNLVGSLTRASENASFGFQLEQIRGKPAQVIARSVEPGSVAYRMGVRNGDVLNIEPTFAAMVIARAPVAGETLRVRDGVRAITLVSQADNSMPPLAIIVALVGSKLAFLLIALLVAIRRSDDSAARALAVFLACFGCGIDFDIALIPAVWARFAWFVFLPATFLTGAAAALAFACRFPEAPRGGVGAILARLVVPLLIVGLAMSIGSTYFGFFAPTIEGPIISVFSVGYTSVYLAITAGTLIALVNSYRRSRGEQRARMRWVVGTFLVGFSGLVVLFVSLVVGSRSQIFQYFSLTTLAIPFGLGYVILRHRVIDMGFVVNRAVVYTTVSLVVVAAFIAFEWLLSHIVEANSGTSTLLSLGGALALGLSVRFIHERVDGYVDDLFFRERHAAEAAIRRFAHEAALITDATDLPKKTVEIAQRNARLEGAAFYRFDGSIFSSIYSTLAASQQVSENDFAVLEMRTWHKPVDLTQRETLVPGETAFPMIVRGALFGFLACGAKTTREALAPDETDALSVLARDCGIALDSLRITTVERELAQARSQLAAFAAPGQAQL